MYTAGGQANVVKVDVPALLPTFTQAGPFTFTPSYPLTFETGGYNAFTTFVAETSTPSLSFAAAYKTPLTSTDPLIDTLMTDARRLQRGVLALDPGVHGRGLPPVHVRRQHQRTAGLLRRPGL